MAGKVKGVVKPGSMKFEANVDGYDLTIDYPGENYQPVAPVPGAMLAFALAGCKALVCAQYFKARKMDVTVEVEVNSDFQREAGRGPYRVHEIVEIRCHGDITQAELQKLQTIVDSECAVEHVILGHDNQIETRYSIY